MTYEPTQRQIALAQQAGDKAYAEALALGRHTSDCYEAYRAALDEEYKRQEREARLMTMPEIIACRSAAGLRDVDDMKASIEEGCAIAARVGGETMEKYNAYCAELDDDQIALMNAMTRETAHDDAKDDAMGRPW